MPIVVQWKERTKSFLVIFHFYDDYSKPNLRFKKRKFISRTTYYEWRQLFYLPINEPLDIEIIKDKDREFQKPVMTWAPSHPEMGYLGEILRYANIIDGLTESEKKELRWKLEVTVDLDNRALVLDSLKPIIDALPNKLFLLGLDFVTRKNKRGEPICCVELCPEYIDYLKKILKPYISN